MAADLATVPLGSVIVIAVNGAANGLDHAAKDALRNMGSKEVNNLKGNDGYLFMGVKGTKSHMEKRGENVNGGMILGYSRVTRRTRTKQTRTVTQSKSYRRTVSRVVKKKVTSYENGVKKTKIVTRVHKKTYTCKASRTMKSSKTTSKTVTH